VVGEYLTGELKKNPNASLQDIENIIKKAKAISSVVSGAVTIQAKGDVSDKDLAIAQGMSASVVENNSLKLLVTLAKIGKKIYKVKGKLSKGKLKKIFKEEALDIADDIMTLLDDEITLDDAFALADLVIGTDLNSKKSKAFRGWLAKKRATVKISRNNARQLLEKRLISQGYSKKDAKIKSRDWVDSFKGDITVSEIKKGSRLFVTHTKGGKASGTFTSRFSEGKTPEERRRNLALPEKNEATSVTTVTVKESHLVLEGKVKGQQSPKAQKEWANKKAVGGGNQLVIDRTKLNKNKNLY